MSLSNTCIYKGCDCARKNTRTVTNSNFPMRFSFYNFPSRFVSCRFFLAKCNTMCGSFKRQYLNSKARWECDYALCIFVQYHYFVAAFFAVLPHFRIFRWYPASGRKGVWRKKKIWIESFKKNGKAKIWLLWWRDITAANRSNEWKKNRQKEKDWLLSSFLLLMPPPPPS